MSKNNIKTAEDMKVKVKLMYDSGQFSYRKIKEQTGLSIANISNILNNKKNSKAEKNSDEKMNEIDSKLNHTPTPISNNTSHKDNNNNQLELSSSNEVKDAEEVKSESALSLDSLKSIKKYKQQKKEITDGIWDIVHKTIKDLKASDKKLNTLEFCQLMDKALLLSGMATNITKLDGVNNTDLIKIINLDIRTGSQDKQDKEHERKRAETE